MKKLNNRGKESSAIQLSYSESSVHPEDAFPSVAGPYRSLGAYPFWSHGEHRSKQFACALCARPLQQVLNHQFKPLLNSSSTDRILETCTRGPFCVSNEKSIWGLPIPVRCILQSCGLHGKIGAQKWGSSSVFTFDLRYQKHDMKPLTATDP